MKLDKRALYIIFGVIIGTLVCLCIDYFEPPKNLDTDCLIDTAMNFDFQELSDTYGKGVITENWTIAELRMLYYQKDYKVKFALKSILNILFNKCEK